MDKKIAIAKLKAAGIEVKDNKVKRSDYTTAVKVLASKQVLEIDRQEYTVEEAKEKWPKGVVAKGNVKISGFAKLPVKFISVGGDFICSELTSFRMLTCADVF